MFGSQLTHMFLQSLVLLQRLHVAQLQLGLIFQNSFLLILPGVSLLVKVQSLAFPLLPLQT